VSSGSVEHSSTVERFEPLIAGGFATSEATQKKALYGKIQRSILQKVAIPTGQDCIDRSPLLAQFPGPWGCGFGE
jgi:hypothetical protein